MYVSKEPLYIKTLKEKKNLKLKTKFQRLVKCQIENSSYYCSRTYTFQSSKNIFARM